MANNTPEALAPGIFVDVETKHVKEFELVSGPAPPAHDPGLVRVVLISPPIYDRLNSHGCCANSQEASKGAEAFYYANGTWHEQKGFEGSKVDHWREAKCDRPPPYPL